MGIRNIKLSRLVKKDKTTIKIQENTKIKKLNQPKIKHKNMHSQFYFPMNNDFAKMFEGIATEIEKNMSETDKKNLQHLGKMFAGKSQSCGEAGNSRAGENKRGCFKRKASNQANHKKEGFEMIQVPMKDFKPSTVDIKVNDKGLMTISATKEEIKETNRNGLRKTTTLVEETVQLPSYLLDHFVEKSEPSSSSKNAEAEKADFEMVDEKKKLLSQVSTKFDNGFLVISYPEMPKTPAEEKVEKDNSSGPVNIDIEFV